jgi:hypothetical protein
MIKSNINILLTKHQDNRSSINHDLKDRIELYMLAGSSKEPVTNVERLDIELLTVVQEVEETKFKINDHLQQHLPQELRIQEEVGTLPTKEEVETVLVSQEHALIVRKLATKSLSALQKLVTNVMLLMQQ